MSQIILDKYDDGENHIVVGWDRAMRTYYWQEFNKEPADWNSPEAEDWEEMLGFGGYDYDELPEIQDLFDHALARNSKVNDAMVDAIDSGTLLPLLREHKGLPYPASNAIVDLTTREE